jgi:hypothetical protein
MRNIAGIDHLAPNAVYENRTKSKTCKIHEQKTLPRHPFACQILSDGTKMAAGSLALFSGFLNLPRKKI